MIILNESLGNRFLILSAEKSELLTKLYSQNPCAATLFVKMDAHLSKLEADAGLSVFLRRLLINESLNDLIKSNTWDGFVNKEFPEHLQARDRTDPRYAIDRAEFIAKFVNAK